jgi:hypothetical protein
VLRDQLTQLQPQLVQQRQQQSPWHTSSLRVPP